MSDKPKWDISLPGSNKAITAPPSDDEMDALRRQLAAQQATINNRKHLTVEEKFYADSQDAVIHNGRNLAEAIERRAEIGVQMAYRFALACALTNIGEFDEARGFVVDYPDFAPLVERIKLLEAAIARPDDEEHHCKRKRERTSHHATGVQAEIELPRRQEVGMVFSKLHNKVVRVWQCMICGWVNAHDLGPPEHQLHLHDHRSREEAKIRQAMRKGVKVSAAMVDHHDSLSDHYLLKPSNG